MSRPSEPDPPRAGGEETRRAVEAVLREQAQRQDRQGRAEEPKPGGDPSAWIWLVALALAALALSVWASPPGWARPEPLPEPSPERIEAGLRMDMWVAVQRIRDFQAERQRLPVTLFEALPEPSDIVGLRYDRISDDGFRLIGTRDGSVIEYDSGEPASELAAAARAVIGEGGRR